MSHLLRSGILAAFVVCGASAFAQLQWPYSLLWTRASVLTSGQNSWAFETDYQDNTSKYGSQGQATDLGQNFGRTWSWREIMDGAKTAETKAQLESYMRQKGLTPQQVAAVSSFDINQRETTFEMSWAYGLTDHWMIGLRVPLIYTQTRVHTTTDYVGQAQLKEKVQELVNQEMQSRGYDSISPQRNRLLWGDVTVLSQVQFLRLRDWAFSIQQFLRFPTSQNPSVADYIQMSRNDGQMDVGLQALADYHLSRWSFRGRVGYLAQLPDEIKMRVPVRTADSVEDMVDRNLKRDLGDGWMGAIDAYYDLSKRWVLNASYQVQRKQRDSYTGDIYSQSDYDELSAGTDEVLHVSRWGVSYLVGKVTARRGIEHKWVTSVNVYTPLSGKNVSRASTAALELRSYF